MASAGAGALSNSLSDLRLRASRVQKSDVLRPGNSRNHSKTMYRRSIQEPFRRRRKGTKSVSTELRYQRQIEFYFATFGKRSAFSRRRKRSVGHSLEYEFFVVEIKEFS